MGTTRIKLSRLQETSILVDFDEVEYREWLGDSADTSARAGEFVRSHRNWGDDLDDLLSNVRESAWTTVDSGDDDTVW